MDGNRFRVIKTLETHESLDKERLSVPEVTMHYGQHGDTHVSSAELCGSQVSTATI